MTVPTERIGKLLALHRRAVDVDPAATYQEIGVRSFGRGLFVKPMITGADLGGKRVFKIKDRDLVVSNVFDWEGAVAVASADHDEMIGSHRFMTWSPRDEDVDVGYLCHYFGSDAGLESLRRASPGSAGRNRTLSIDNFKAIEVPLPKIDEQRRIAAHLEAIAHRAAQLVHQADRTSSAHRAANGAIDDWIVKSGAPTPMHKIAVINPRPVPVRPDDEVTFVPMAAVDPSAGAIRASEVRRRSELASGYKQFLSGDLIFARITPCMQNGKCAIYANADGRVAYGSTEFLVLRPRDPHLAEWLHAVLRTAWFRNQAARAFTGTAGQQRVPAAFISDVAIPLPDAKRLAQALAQLSDLGRLDVEVHRTAEKRAALAKALLPAARNEIFSAMR